MPLTPLTYHSYGTYGWQVTKGSEKDKEQARFASGFMDIYDTAFALMIDMFCVGGIAMKSNDSTKKAFSAKGCVEAIALMNILGVLLWLFPLMCKEWLLSISPEEFYGKYTSTFMICAAWPVIQSSILLFHAMQKKDFSISSGMKVDLWMILAINVASLFFIIIANGVICANVEISSFAYRQFGEFILRYGLIYVAAMLFSALLGAIALRHIRKGEGSSLEAK